VISLADKITLSVEVLERHGTARVPHQLVSATVTRCVICTQ
jgi:hypothetical protein